MSSAERLRRDSGDRQRLRAEELLRSRRTRLQRPPLRPPSGRGRAPPPADRATSSGPTPSVGPGTGRRGCRAATITRSNRLSSFPAQSAVHTDVLTDRRGAAEPALRHRRRPRDIKFDVTVGRPIGRPRRAVLPPTYERELSLGCNVRHSTTEAPIDASGRSDVTTTGLAQSTNDPDYHGFLWAPGAATPPGSCLGLAQVRVQEIGPNLEALTLSRLRDEGGGELIGDRNEDLVAENDRRSGEHPAAGFARDDLPCLEVVVEPELAGVVLEHEQHLLTAPDNRRRVRLEKELAALLWRSIGDGDEAAVPFHRLVSQIDR